MAFNPFHSFRRHQKKFFAALTIMCMFIFVLSSGMGKGDFFTVIGDWLAGRGGSAGKAPASLYGKDVDSLTINNTQKMRLIAGRYIDMAIESAHQNIMRSIMAQQDKLDPILQERVRGLMQLQMQLQLFGDQIQPARLAQEYQRMARDLIGARQVLDAGSAPNKTEQMQLADNVRFLLEQKADRLTRAPGESHFGGNVQKLDDTLNFLIWKHKADELGVHYNATDVADEVRTETLFNLVPEAAKQIDELLRSEYRGIYSPDLLNTALAEEFRVRAAQASVAGVAPLFRTKTFPPVISTPDEAYDWFKDNRTLIRVGLTEVPVANFVSKVTSNPDEAQLKELYSKYKGNDPNPADSQPGFRDPRKVKIEWVGSPEKSEFHRTVALASLALDPILLETRLAEQQETYASNLPSWTGPLAYGYRTGIHDSSVLRAENIASLLGASVASGVTGGGPFTGGLSFEAAAIIREIKDRARIGCSTILAAAAESGVWGIDALPLALIPKGLTPAQLRPSMLVKVEEDLTKTIRDSDRTTFQNELFKRGKDGDAKAVEAYITEYVTTRKCERGVSNELRDRFTLASDPGLAPVRAAYSRVMSMRSGEDPNGEAFGTELIDGPADRANRSAKPRNFNPQSLPSTNTYYMFWRNEDQEAKVLPFEQAKPQVVAAWKYGKARELAKAEADKLAAEAKGMDPQKLRDLAARTGARSLIELPPMAMRNQRLALATGGRADYDWPMIPRDRVTYPGDMAYKLMDLRKQAPGATMVVADQPQAVYYVAGLIGKEVPTIDEFRTAYRNSMAPVMVRDPLLQIFQSERQEAYRAGLLTQLRKEANVQIHDKKGNQEEEGAE